MDPERHVSYVPLYTAGKLIFASAALLWLLFSIEAVLGAMSLGTSGIAGSMALSVLLIPADLVSILAARLLRGRSASPGVAEPPRASVPEPWRGAGPEQVPEPGPADLAETVDP